MGTGSVLDRSAEGRSDEPALVLEKAEKVGLFGRSPAHLSLLRKLFKVAQIDVEVLISGPSGVGKELYARYLHECSARRAGRFVAVNCGALPDPLFENEMFGHAAGAYTGAPSHAEGMVAAAEGGTLFLDEVDTLSPHAQVKLLRLLQEREYRRLGDARIRRADIRLVAATNCDLPAAVREGWFREDLFFRLRVVPIDVPPLSQRMEDLPLLLSVFVIRYADNYHLSPIRFTQAAQYRLLTYGWPGNIRELENCVRNLTCQQLDDPIQPKDLPLLDEPPPEGETPEADPASRPFQEAKRIVVERFEREYLDAVLQRSGGNISRAARLSGKNRRAFFELLRKHDIDAAAYRPA